MHAYSEGNVVTGVFQQTHIRATRNVTSGNSGIGSWKDMQMALLTMGMFDHMSLANRITDTQPKQDL